MNPLLLFVVFTLLLTVSFGVMAFLMRPRHSENVTEKRLASVMLKRRIVLIKPAGGEMKGGDLAAMSWFNKLPNERRIFKPLRELLLQAQSLWTINQVIGGMAALALVALLAVWFLADMPLLAIAAAVPAGYIPIAVLKMKRAKHLAAFQRVLPDAIELCARSLRAGHSMAAAIGNIAEEGPEPAKTEFREVFKQQNHGIPLRDALRQMSERIPSRDLQVLITGILVQRDTGGNLAEIMDRIVSVIRDRIRIQGDIKTQTAQGRLTGWILCLLPIVLLALINLLNPGYSRVLFTDPTGKKMLYGGVFLLIMGGFIIRQIVRGVEV